MKIVQIVQAPMDMWMNIPTEPGADSFNTTPVVCLGLTEGGEVWPLTAADLGYRSGRGWLAQGEHKLRFERVAILERNAARAEGRISVVGVQ